MTLNETGSRAKKVLRVLGTLGSREKNMGLEEAARALLEGEEEILEASFRDYEKARSDSVGQRPLDRLKLTPARIQAMAGGLLQVAALEDPMGEILSMKLHPSDLQTGQKRVPLGVVGMVREARPNVTTNAFSLCFKSDNVIILKGGSDALYSNTAITRCLHAGLSSASPPRDSIQLIEDTGRDTARELIRLNRYTDVLTPRRGAGLIKAAMENNTIPVIETGTDNYYVYVGTSVSQNMTLDIISNVKTQRIDVYNTCESLLVRGSIAGEFLPPLRKKLEEKQMEIWGGEDVCVIELSFVRATEENWGRGYPDYILPLKLVDLMDEAVRHVNTYDVSHSETIMTSDYFNAQRFSNEADATAACVNVSTRFTDDEGSGFGAEIGISTQKFHARDPMGLKGLTTTKYIIYGDGQIR